MTHERLQLRNTILNVFECDLLESLDAKRLDGVAGQGGPLHDGLHHVFAIDLAKRLWIVFFLTESAAQKPQHSSSKAIACSGRIDQCVAWIRRQGQHGIWAKDKATVFSFLEDDPARAHGLNASGSLNHVIFSGELFGFDVVDKESIDTRKDIEQLTPRGIDPHIDRIGKNPLSLPALIEDL